MTDDTFTPAQAVPELFDQWFDDHFLDPDGRSAHLPDWLKDDLKLAWNAALAAQPPAAPVEGSFNCQTCERECDGPDGSYRCPVEQLRLAQTDIDIAAYNAAKFRIGLAIAALDSPCRSSAETGEAK